jgi:hypothetical protein
MAKFGLHVIMLPALVARDEIACSMKHEGWIWPEASIRAFMPFPARGSHLCSQCTDYPCIASCQSMLCQQIPDQSGDWIERSV